MGNLLLTDHVVLCVMDHDQDHGVGRAWEVVLSVLLPSGGAPGMPVWTQAPKQSQGQGATRTVMSHGKRQVAPAVFGGRRLERRVKLPVAVEDRAIGYTPCLSV